MNICDTNLFGNGLLYVTFNQDQGGFTLVILFFKYVHNINAKTKENLHLFRSKLFITSETIAFAE